MMKSASLLDQEKEGLDRMIDKLTNLAKAFEILGELTSANKKQYEFLMNKIGGLEKLCESLSGSKLLKATIKQPFFLLHKDKYQKLVKVFSIFHEKFTLGPLSILLDNLTFRKTLMVDNLTAMRSAISRQYDTYAEKFEVYVRESREFKLSLANMGPTLKDPLVYFDILEMVRTVASTLKSKDHIVGLEAAAIKELNQLNAQVHGLHILVANSTAGFKEVLQKARKTLLELADSAIREYRTMSNGFLDFAEGISTKVVWQENVEPVKSPLDYAEVLLASWKDNSSEETKKLEEIMGELKSRVDISRETYFAIANFLEEQVSLISIEIDTHYKPLVEDVSNLCLNLLRCLSWFPENHRAVRKKVGADNSNLEFVRIFEASFQSKSIQLIDHLFFFFEIFQKTLTETILESLDLWGKEYGKVMGNMAARLDQEMKALESQKKTLEKVKGLAVGKDKGDMNLTTRSQIVDSIENVQIEMAKAVILIAGETTKSVKFSFEFIEKTLNSLVKVFDALNSHSELTLGDENSELSDEELNHSMKEYFNLEGELLAFMNSKKDTSLQGQLILDSPLDKDLVEKVITQLFGGWLDHICPYLQPLQDHQELLGQLDSILKQGNSKNMLLSPEINLFLEVTDEDVNMASIYKYSARLTKKGVPCNGTLMLMSEYLIFFCKSIAANINLILPYRCITGLRQIKNFIGMGNGLSVGTAKGCLEFFLSDSTVRDQMLNRLQTSVDSLKIVSLTPLFESLCFRKTYFWPDSNGQLQEKLIPAPLHEKMRAHIWRTIKKVNVRYLDLKSPVAKKTIAGTWIGAVEELFFQKEGLRVGILDYTSFVHAWVSHCGSADGLEQPRDSTMPRFLSSNYKSSASSSEEEARLLEETERMNEFFAEATPRALGFEFVLPDIGQVHMKLTVFNSHPDQLEVNIQANSSKRMTDFEGLLIGYQGGRTGASTAAADTYLELYWKQGIKPFDGAHHLFGSRFLELIQDVISNKKEKDAPQGITSLETSAGS